MVKIYIGDKMQIRLGYACITETLPITTSHTYTYTNFLKEKDYQKIDSIIKLNLFSLKKILIYNIKNNIHFYRISSNLIPLATKNDVSFDYLTPYKKDYQEIAALIKNNNLRVDFHPSEFCVINSTKKEVVKQSIDILKYHYNLMKILQITNQVLVVHIGSSAFGKKNSITRFCHNFMLIPKEIQKVIAIENDDKVFNIDDCLEITRRLSIPIVFDYHHHFCNPGTLSLEDTFPLIIESWHQKIPKVHFSSPKGLAKNTIRSHSDYIDSEEFIKFIKKIAKYNSKVDIMLEAKKKDEALFKLVRELKYYQDFPFSDETTFTVK